MIKADFYEALAEIAFRECIQKIVMGGVIINQKKFLLLERKADDFMGGIFELPSGKVEEGESLKDALYREVKEETGLRIKRVIKYLGYFDYVSGSGKRTRQFNFLVEPESVANIVLTEHKSFVWVDKTEIGKYNVTDSVKGILLKL
jgi:8-oxo-dGTP diphosphatase